MKRRILFSLLSLVLILSLVIIPTGCPKRDAATPTTDAERIAALESKVSQLQSKIASLPESDSTDYSGDINALYDDIGTLYDEIDNLGMELDDILVEVDEMLATWEEEQEASNGSSSSGGEGETTRWTPTISLEQASLDVAIEASSIKWHPSSIREEDTYSIAFEVTNSHQDEARQVSLVIVFTPSSRDTVVDIGNTGLYSTTSPIIWWDSDFTPSDGVECRRIEFISDLFSIPKDTTLEISLDFDLYYAE